MEHLSFITCAACILFLNGKCNCFTQSGGPRSTGTCQSCKCVVIWYLTEKKKQSRKTLFHLNTDRNCDCFLPCLEQKNGSRCLKQGKLAFHAECRKYWKPCAHMALVTAQLEEYTTLVKDGNPKVPIGCIPLLGYEKRKSTLLRIDVDGRNFLQERKAALVTYKEKKYCNQQNAAEQKNTNAAMTSPVKINKEDTSLLAYCHDHDIRNITLHQYLNLVRTIEALPANKVY